MPNLRGIKGKGERILGDRKAESDEEFDLGSGEEAEEGYGGRTQRNEPEPTEQWGGKAKKGRKAKIKTLSDVVKGVKTDDESETADAVVQFDSEKMINYRPSRREGNESRHRKKGFDKLMSVEVLRARELRRVV